MITKHKTDMSADEESHLVWIDTDEPLKEAGFTVKQALIFLYVCAAYAGFVIAVFIPTLSAPWIKVTWPSLFSRNLYFNGLFAGQAIASTLASVVTIPLAELFGRRPIILVGIVFCLIFSLMSAASPSFELYAVFRSLSAGFGCIGATSAIVYGLELSNVTRTGLMATVLQCVSSLAMTYCTGINWSFVENTSIETTWRFGQVVMLLPVIVLLPIGIFLYYESPRYLLTSLQDKSGAWSVFSKLHAGGRAAYEELYSTKDLEHDVKFLTVDDAPASHQRKPNIGTVMKNWSTLFQLQYLRATLTLMALWIAASFSSWGFQSYIYWWYQHMPFDANLTLLLGYVCQVPVHIAVYFIGEASWGGHITAMSGNAVLTTIASLTLTILIAIGVPISSIYAALAAITMIFGGSMWSSLYAYTAEIYPASMRGSAMAVLGIAAGLSAIVSTYIGSIMVDKPAAWLFPFVFTASKLIMTILTRMLVIEVTPTDPAVGLNPEHISDHSSSKSSLN